MFRQKRIKEKFWEEVEKIPTSAVDTSELYRKTHAALHPIRIKILDFVADNPDLHISKIAKKIGMNRSTVSYHLGLLEKFSLVDSEYKILQPPHSVGKAGRIYRVNEKEIKKIAEAISKRLSDL